ncbi:MAG: phosphoadenosine phosphosulfate reductase family protein [Nitrospira sp.]|nr:phosphoadenosine phosphosulfate reductase family protein [bacterium]MBL7048981.1 phosphoadenosine phosphosulfate reductase family protein [Nitrospira sp.]
MEIETMEELMAMSLDEKSEQTKNVIREAIDKYGVEKIAIAWTGGKDSTTMLWHFREVCKELGVAMPRCMFIDEGYVFEEIWDMFNLMKKEWHLNVVIAKNTDVSDKAEKVGDMVKVSSLNERNRKEIELLEITDEEFPFEPESFIGNHLMKTIAMNMFIEEYKIEAVATAIRWDEQEARVQEDYISHKKNPPHDRVQPILHFMERDIWNFMFQKEIPYCTLYKEGYRSLGAKGSTTKMSDIPAWEQDLENTYERAGRGQGKEEIMAKLRDLGYM